MLIEVDLTSSEPLYGQIAAGVRRAIAEGEVRGGDTLPPGRTLAGALGVNLETVQRAYRQLADEGVVVSRVGRGTRVAESVDPGRLGVRDQLEALVTRASALGISRQQLAAMLASSERADLSAS